jgi:hypothetical protein
MVRNLGYLMLIALVIFAIIDCLQSEDDERAGLPKWAWIILMIIFPLVGSIAYLVVTRTMRSRRGPQPEPGWGDAPARRVGPAPTSPDDDPEFLWLLEQKRRQDERNGRRPAADGTIGGPTDEPLPGPNGVANGDGTDDGTR